jgi:hypothetical protein
MRNVFDLEMVVCTLTVAKECQFIDIFSDTSLVIKFMAMPLPELSNSVQN